MDSPRSTLARSHSSTGSLEPGSRWALGWQAALAAYMQLISWVPLGRWNRQPCCPTGLEQLGRGTLEVGEALGLLAFLILPLLFWWGSHRGLRWAMWLSIAAYSIWLGLQLWTWWPPYLFGASEHWAEVYERAFAHSTPILPRWGDHLPPDAMHLVLQVLLVGVVTSGIWALLRRPTSQVPRGST